MLAVFPLVLISSSVLYAVKCCASEVTLFIHIYQNSPPQTGLKKRMFLRLKVVQNPCNGLH